MSEDSPALPGAAFPSDCFLTQHLTEGRTCFTASLWSTDTRWEEAERPCQPMPTSGNHQAFGLDHGLRVFLVWCQPTSPSGLTTGYSFNSTGTVCPEAISGDHRSHIPLRGRGCALDPAGNRTQTPNRSHLGFLSLRWKGHLSSITGADSPTKSRSSQVQLLTPKERECHLWESYEEVPVCPAACGCTIDGLVFLAL